jgi:hypothetical protein
MTEHEQERADAKQAWDEVAEGFSTLGRQLRERMHTEGGASDRRTLEESLRHLGDVVTRIGEQAGATAKDPEFRQTAQQVAGSLRTALAASFSGIGEEIGAYVSRTRAARSGTAAADAEEENRPDDAWREATTEADVADSDAPPAEIEHGATEPEGGAEPAPSLEQETARRAAARDVGGVKRDGLL